RPGGRAIALFGTWTFEQGRVASRLGLWDLSTRTNRSLTPNDLPAGTIVRAASWSTNGQRVATLVTLPSSPAEPVARLGFAPPAMNPFTAVMLMRLGQLQFPLAAVQIIDADTVRLVQSVYCPAVRSLGVRLSPCGRWIVVETGDGIRLHAVEDGRLVREFT